MKQDTYSQMPAWLRKTLLYSLGLVLVLMPFHAFISTWGGTAIGPLWLWKSWKEILIVVLVVMTVGWLLTKPAIIRQLSKNPLIDLVTLYVLFHVVMVLFFISRNGLDATSAGLAMNLRYLGAASLAYLLLTYGTIRELWLKWAIWFVLIAGLVVAVLGIIQALFVPADFLTNFGYSDTTIAPAVLIDDQPDLLRAFATLRGPNDFGAYLILPFVLVVAWFRRFPAWLSIGMLAVLSWAIVLSSSRSAWIGLVIAVAAYLALIAGKRLSLKAIGFVIAGLLLLGVVGLYASVNISVLRQAVFHSSPGDPSLTEGSTDDHIQATTNGVFRVINEPLGCGVGCAGPASYYGPDPRISENYFVQIAEEVGLLGLLLFLMIIGLVAYKLYRAPDKSVLSRVLLAVLLGHIAIAMLLHVWSDDPLSITWWLLAGAVIGYNESKTWTKSKNSLRSRTSSSS
ncbi:MAG: O-antigen ligase family protein [Candidatus Saccharimonadales bacterium]